jgi:hypothetical protein
MKIYVYLLTILLSTLLIQSCIVWGGLKTQDGTSVSESSALNSIKGKKALLLIRPAKNDILNENGTKALNPTAIGKMT